MGKLSLSSLSSVPSTEVCEIEEIMKVSLVSPDSILSCKSFEFSAPPSVGGVEEQWVSSRE